MFDSIVGFVMFLACLPVVITAAIVPIYGVCAAMQRCYKLVVAR